MQSINNTNKRAPMQSKVGNRHHMSVLESSSHVLGLPSPSSSHILSVSDLPTLETTPDTVTLCTRFQPGSLSSVDVTT